MTAQGRPLHDDPAWPMTAPELEPTNVTDVGRNPGAGGPEPALVIGAPPFGNVLDEGEDRGAGSLRR
jgi:hypothetical protein